MAPGKSENLDYNINCKGLFRYNLRNSGGIGMSDKGKKDKRNHEKRKEAQHSLKEKRQLKKDKKQASN